MLTDGPHRLFNGIFQPECRCTARTDAGIGKDITRPLSRQIFFHYHLVHVLHNQPFSHPYALGHIHRAMGVVHQLPLLDRTVLQAHRHKGKAG